MKSPMSVKQAAKALSMSEIDLRELMKRERLPIGYAIKRDGAERWHFQIYPHLVEKEAERLGLK